jgi:hypothetical protein
MAESKGGPKADGTKKPKRTRVAITPEVKNEVLRKCRRRCCMCFFLRRIDVAVDGQIAHLDQDNSNPQPDNLAYLCLECHKNYDRKSNRVQGYTPEEIKSYRDRMYLMIGPDQIEWNIRIRIAGENYNQIRPIVASVRELFKNFDVDIFITEGAGS